MGHTNTSGATPDTAIGTGEHEPLTHILPGWFQKLQDRAFLGLLIVAQGLVVGNMLASGLVGDTGNPFAGGVHDWLHEATWVALFAAGFIMGGMSVRTSAATFYWLFRHKGLALLNFAGCVLFVVIEVWAGLVARSAHSIVTPADVAALTWAGLTHPTLTISDVLTSVAIPFAAMFWGFSAMKPAQKSAAEIEAEGAAKLAKAQANAAVRQAQAAGWGATLRAGAAATFARQDTSDSSTDPATSSTQVGGFDPDNPGGGMSVFPATYGGISGGDSSASSFGQPAPSSQKLRPVGQAGGVPVGWISAAGLRTWVRETLGVEVSQSDALALIKGQANARRCSPDEHVQGSPVIAPKPAALNAARRKWGARPSGQVSGE